MRFRALSGANGAARAWYDWRMDRLTSDRSQWLGHITRRHFLRDCGSGLGALALSQLMAGSAGAATTAGDAVLNPLAPRRPPQFGKAKRVLFLHLSGGPP